MDNKLVMISIATVIGIIVLGSVLMPILDDATATTETFDNTNDALFKVEKITADTPYSFVWDVASPTTATVNGVEVNLIPSTLICTSEKYLIRYNYNAGTGNSSIQSVGESLGVILSTSSATTGTLTIDNTTNAGYLTFTVVKDGGSPTVKTYAIGETYGISDKGDYVMKSSNQVAYLLEDSPILAMGLTTFNGDYATGFYISGNPGDGFTVTNFLPVPATATVSNVTSDLAEVDDYVDLFTLKEIKFDLAAVSDPTITGNATYSYFIIPAEVTAEKSVHFTDGQNAIFAAMPVMIILAVLLGVAALVIRSRMD